MKRNSWLLLFFLAISQQTLAQTSFQYKRSIIGVQADGWYTLTLPDGMFRHLSRDLGDLRLYSVNDGDSLEVPYLLRILEDEISQEKVDLPLFNMSYRNNMLYLTFELQPGRKVNYIDLGFAQLNYFGHVSLEGSDDRVQWFEIVKDQRIVSINKDGVNFKESTVRFPITGYRYLRASVNSDVPLQFNHASFAYNTLKPGNFRDFSLTWKLNSDKKSRQSVIDIKLTDFVPVSTLHLQIDRDADYYRSFTMEYVVDSTRTDKGWIKNYRGVFEGLLTSFRTNSFDFPVFFARELRLVIRDLDNRPLPIKQISAAGPEVVITSYLRPDDNFMLYGAEAIDKPSYDLAHFQSNIPDSTATARFGPVESLSNRMESKPLFENKLWLWSIMVVMIGGLGYFTMKMVNGKG